MNLSVLHIDTFSTSPTADSRLCFSSMEKDIRILLVDDHVVLHEGFKHMLGHEEDMEVVGESANGEETQIEILSPNMMLTDIKMPVMDGIDLIRHLKEQYASCNVIVLTIYDFRRIEDGESHSNPLS